MSGSVQSWQGPSDGSWQFQLMGPQSKVGSGGQWYLRAPGSVNGDSGVLPSLQQISAANQGAVTGHPVIAAANPNGSGLSSGNVTVVPGPISVIPLGATWPAWAMPVMGSSIFAVIILCCGLGTWIYSSRKRAQDEAEEIVLAEKKRRDKQEQAALELRKVASDDEGTADDFQRTLTRNRTRLYEAHDYEGEQDMGVDEHDEDNGTLDVTDSRSAFSFPSASQASGALGSTGAYPSYPQQQYSMYPLPQAPVAVHYPPSQFSAYPQHPVMVGHQFPAPPPTTAGFSAIPPQQLSSSPLTSPVSGAGSLGRRPHQPSQSRPFEDSGASHMKQPSSPPPRRGASTRDDPDSTDQRNRR